jgi:hypothetical protein
MLSGSALKLEEGLMRSYGKVEPREIDNLEIYNCQIWSTFGGSKRYAG